MSTAPTCACLPTRNIRDQSSTFVSALLLFGGSGQLGTALRSLAQSRWDVRAPSSSVVSLANPADVVRAIEETRPHVVVNAAAYTRVDDAETDVSNAFAINATAVEAMAQAARRAGAYFVHVSTDYVFDGTGALPYLTTAPTHALNVYGASKLAGEDAVAANNPDAAVVRTSWVHSGGGVNFVATCVRLFRAGTSMRVVDDQVGAPTRAAHLAHAVLLLAERRDVSGLLHFTDCGVASWYDVACCVLDTMRAMGRVADTVTVTPVDSGSYPRPAKRPHVAILDTHSTRATLGWAPQHWRDGVIASTTELLDA